MLKPPSIACSLQDLPNQADARHASFVDIFGIYVMWIRKTVMSRAQERIRSEDARPRGIGGTVYEQAAALSPQQQELRLELAERCVDESAQLLLVLLANVGSDFTIGDGHAFGHEKLARTGE